MGGHRWIARSKDPHRRVVLESSIVSTMGNDQLFALSLDCGHTVYLSKGKRRKDYAPKTYRCTRCMVAAISGERVKRKPTPAESAIAGYVAGAGVSVMAATRAVMALEKVSVGETAREVAHG